MDLKWPKYGPNRLSWQWSCATTGSGECRWPVLNKRCWNMTDVAEVDSVAERDHRRFDSEGKPHSKAVQDEIEARIAEDARIIATSYATRGNAVRAARETCKKIFGSAYCAFEGPDYYIHPVSVSVWSKMWGKDRYLFDLSPMVKEEAERLKAH